MSAQLDQDNFITALKYHGYVFSDEEGGSTDSDSDYSDLEEIDELKPPPLVIPREKILLIKAAPIHKRKQKKKNSLEKRQDPLQQNKAKKRTGPAPISTNNFFKVLQQDSSSEDSEAETAEEINNRVLQQNQDKEINFKLLSDVDAKFHDFFEQDSSQTNDKIYTDNENFRPPLSKISTSTLVQESVLSEERDDDIKESDLEDETHAFQCVISKRKRKAKDEKRINKPTNKLFTSKTYKKYSSSFLIQRSKSNKISVKKKKDRSPKFFYQGVETRTSWDYISRNDIHRSDKLIEQEYDTIVLGPEPVDDSSRSEEEILEKPVTTASRRVTMTPSVSAFLRDLEYFGCFNVIILIAAYFWRRYTK